VAIFSYQLTGGRTRWMFTIDLPPAANGRRRQMNRRGFVSQDAAQAAETEARKAYARADLAADGSLAAELDMWLGERELDVQQTTLGNYRDLVRCYINPHLGSRQVYTLTKRAIHDLYKTLLTRGSKRGGPVVADDGADGAPGADEGVEGSARRHRRGPRAAQGRPGDPGA
jgi:hypothetical protein